MSAYVPGLPVYAAADSHAKAECAFRGVLAEYQNAHPASPRRLVQSGGRAAWDVTADGQRFLTTVPQVQRAAPTSISVILNWPALLKK